jgi:hypothetical protein
LATIEECHAALGRLSTALRGLDSDKRERQVLDRSVSCRVPDLDVVFNGRLDGDGFHDITTEAAPKAQIGLTIPSDDLVALADGQLNFASAWAQGKVKVSASFGDLLRLRKLF